jgi:hypothetical protein
VGRYTKRSHLDENMKRKNVKEKERRQIRTMGSKV